MRKIFVPVILFAFAATAAAQNLSVGDAMTINRRAGEAQSTVVPPGVNPQCQQGRFLVTDDGLRPPSGVVFGRDLDQTAGPATTSAFDMGTLASNFDADPKKSNYFFGTNDHDLLTLSNGDVLYITGAFSRMPMRTGRPAGSAILADPAWFKDTFRTLCLPWDGTTCQNPYDFGPNARSTVLVFRSTDCGANFKFVSEMDPARFGGGTCAQPQFRAKAGCDWTKQDCRDTEKPYDMGGTDGQLVRVDPANDRLYLTFQCVGYQPDASKKPEFVLDPANKINKTLVLMSDTAGASWRSLGYINAAAWRFGVVPFGDELAFGFSSSVLYGKRNPATSKFEFDSTGTVAPNGSWSWMGEWHFKDAQGNTNVPVGNIGSNVLAVPFVVRTPDSKNLLLAFPDRFATQGWGYRVFFFNRATEKLVEVTSIVPAKPVADNVVFHLAAADPGTGPVLLYWTDLDSATKAVTVRGRLVTGPGQFSDDFTISQTAGKDASFQLAGSEYWYGDYHTAGAYLRRSSQTAGQGKFTVDTVNTARYVYYPMWVEPNSTVRYARVEYAVKGGLMSTAPLMRVREVIVRAVPPEKWKPAPAPVELSRIRRLVRPVKEQDMRPRRPQGGGPIIIRPRP